jgi:hypothetical protein
MEDQRMDNEIMGGLWALAFIGGPILLAIFLAYGVIMRYRRRRKADRAEFVEAPTTGSQQRREADEPPRRRGAA